MNEEMRAFGYLCPKCGKTVLGARSVFALAASGENPAGAAALALGIGIQNFPEGAAIALPLRQEGNESG